MQGRPVARDGNTWFATMIPIGLCGQRSRPIGCQNYCRVSDSGMLPTLARRRGTLTGAMTPTFISPADLNGIDQLGS
jgi:hypothetical protein